MMHGTFYCTYLCSVLYLIVVIYGGVCKIVILVYNTRETVCLFVEAEKNTFGLILNITVLPARALASH